jgi:hypothetical protein
MENKINDVLTICINEEGAATSSSFAAGEMLPPFFRHNSKALPHPEGL